jgi:hypothetical protein
VHATCPAPPHPPWFNHRNTIRWRIQIVNSVWGMLYVLIITNMARARKVDAITYKFISLWINTNGSEASSCIALLYIFC